TALAAPAGVAAPPSALVPVVLGEPERAFAAAQRCAELGVRVGCFRPPSVPAGTSRLRLTARADLTDADLDLARRVLVQVLAAS
ncbi:aminotransferase class I/II-fold pyridoxal phosphate-dependent enzyme, partial [Pseudonocardia benzenivorans]